MAVALVDTHRHGDGHVLVEGFFLGVFQERGEGLRAAQRRLGVDLLCIRFKVTFVLVLHHLEFGRPLVRIDVVAVLGHHLHKQLAVGGLVVVLEVCIGQSLQQPFGGHHLVGIFCEEPRSAEAHTQSKQHNVTADQPGFQGVHPAAHSGIRLCVVGFNQSQRVSIRGFAICIAGGPTVEERLNFLLLELNFQSLQPFGLSDVVLPVVGGLGVLGGVLDAHGLVGVHVALHGLQLQIAALHHGRVVKIDGLFHAPAAQEAVGASWVAHDHREVALRHAVHADVQVALGGVGDIVFAVRRGVVVCVGVDADHAEVSGVAGPHPVVGVASVLAHAFWRGRDKAHIVVVAVREDVVLVAVVHRLHVVVQGAVCRLEFCADRAELSLDGRSAVCLRHVVVDLGQNAFCDVVNAVQEAHVEIVDVHFLVLAFGPKPIGQVVVLWGAEALDGTVGTVVVGQDQSLRRDDFCGATAAVQTHDRVFQGGVVDVVDVLGAQAKA